MHAWIVAVLKVSSTISAVQDEARELRTRFSEPTYRTDLHALPPSALALLEELVPDYASR